MTYAEQMQRVVTQYQEAGERWPATTYDMAAWAIRMRLWSPSPSAMIDECAEQLARAMREEYIEDVQGRTVRAKHAARREVNGVQMTMWADIRTAPRDHMELAFQQRRQQILGDCRQLKADADSYNENKNPGEAIQMVFDFTVDLEEIEAVTRNAPHPV